MSCDIDKYLHEVDQTKKDREKEKQEFELFIRKSPSITDAKQFHLDDERSLSDGDIPLSYEELGLEPPPVFCPSPVNLSSDSESDSYDKNNQIGKEGFIHQEEYSSHQDSDIEIIDSHHHEEGITTSLSNDSDLEIIDACDKELVPKSKRDASPEEKR